MIKYRYMTDFLEACWSASESFEKSLADDFEWWEPVLIKHNM